MKRQTPVIEYISCTDEKHFKEIKRFLQAYVALPEDPVAADAVTFFRNLDALEKEQSDLLFLPLLAIASDDTLKGAVSQIQLHHAYICSFGDSLLNELERRQAASQL